MKKTKLETKEMRDCRIRLSKTTLTKVKPDDRKYSRKGYKIEKE